MDKIEYAATVIAAVHAQTIQGKLPWRTNPGMVVAEPTSTIMVMIGFEDDGPDSAVWESVMIKHPVGKGITILGNLASSKSRLYEPITSAQTLAQVNEVFRYVLLEPRKREFEAAMKELGGK